MGNPQTESSAIACSCGRVFSHVSTLTPHLEDTACVPSISVQRTLARRQVEIASMLEVHRIEIARLEGEARRLSVLATAPPAPSAQRARPCLTCGRLTRERFGTRPQCAKHTARQDPGMRAVVENLLYGDDDE